MAPSKGSEAAHKAWRTRRANAAADAQPGETPVDPGRAAALKAWETRRANAARQGEEGASGRQFAWVPWFQDLAQKINEGGEEFLVETARKVDWDAEKTPPLLANAPASLDPFSFFYYLAAKSAWTKSRKVVYPSVDEAFGTSFEGDVEDDNGFIFPVPPPFVALFRDGPSFRPAPLWRLFRSAVEGMDKVSAEDFEGVLDFKGVGIPKLTQALFLVNPSVFLPCDSDSAFQLCGNLASVTDWATYRSESDVVRAGFPGCEPYEVNAASFMLLHEFKDKPYESWRSSTMLDGGDGDDYWDDFRRNSWVYHHGPGKDDKRGLHRPKPGDVVLVHTGKKRGRGIGIVLQNDHAENWDDQQAMYVLWINTREARLAAPAPRGAFSRARGATLEAFRGTDSYKPTFKILDGRPTPIPSVNGLTALAEETLISEAELREIAELLEDKKQVVFQGPPGTGKTYLAKKLAEHLAGSPARVRLVQFHPSYAYEDFVQGFRPTLSKEHGAGFELRDGPLVEAAKAAEDKPEEKHFLIVDEVNRGNLSKILGELYFLLEYRDETIQLQYSSEGFRLPANLYLIGTMNTADRSIAVVDLALRRRFHFVEFHPDKPPIEGLLERWLEAKAPKMTWVKDVVAKANQKLDDRHAAIGPSYFMREGLDDAKIETIWKHSVLPYIEERLFGQEERLKDFDVDKLRGKPEKDSAADEASDGTESNESADATT